MSDYSRDIYRAKQKALDALNARIDQMDKVVYTTLLQTIEETFKVKDSKIQGGKDFDKQLNKLTIDVLDLIQADPKFTGPVSQLVKRDASNSGAINTKILEQFNMNGLLMTGSLIDISSPQCKYVINELGGKITRESWPQIKAIAEKHGLIQGTTFDNLPTNKLHKKCRHDFYPIMFKKTL